MFTPTCWKRCECGALTDGRIQGFGVFTQPPPSNRASIDEQYSLGLGKPESDFFQRLYPNSSYNIQNCIPTCVPNTWRLDLVRQSLLNTAENNIHLVPMYWQLASSPETTEREPGDCTHKNLVAIELMLFQWIRNILS
mmetsp:Transcript_4228/g.7871  ORF Transcript_4228/g.7871 Transcript_4228/m.7871 type:complete len:138 (-) Transcript_4228:1350-1763(-)